MREVKFRAWHREYKAMGEVAKIDMWGSEDQYTFDLAFIGDLQEFDVLIGDIDLMQYTGLKDKNGKEIYEGDIVTTKFGRVCKVEWFESPSMLCWDLVPIAMFENPTPSKFDLWDSDNVEVIGNIYENPELLN
ncbi:hypothetical protein HGB07_10205 [Candidatus Roizmanbacteria bacterium]|nr:hypothetical protein [Candidatus Roizmanbacteria bacterium]